MTYGCETWKLTKQAENLLRVAPRGHPVAGHSGEGLGVLWLINGRGLASSSGQCDMETSNCGNWLYALGAGDE